MFAGGMAGIGFWFFIYPVDVIKSKMQVAVGRTGPSGGIMALTKDVWRNEGIPGFYRGLLPCLLRAFPAAASTFLAYEYSKDFLTGLLVT